MIKKDNIIVLMYHGVVKDVDKHLSEEKLREVGAGIYDVFVEDFEAHLKWIVNNGYQVIVDPKQARPDKDYVILTFDDGEKNNREVVLPILQKYGMQAYFFIMPPRVGRKGYMTWEDIQYMREAGMVIGSHGLSHEILTNLLDTQVEEEFRASKKSIEVNLGHPINAVSIPRGFCNKKIIEIAHSYGFQYIFISERPRFSQMGVYNRVAVKRHWDMPRFIMAMDGRMPFMEKIAFNVRDLAKFILRERGYNFVRNMFIRLFH